MERTTKSLVEVPVLAAIAAAITAISSVSSVCAATGAGVVTVVNRTKNQTFNIGAQNLAEINAAYPVPPQENVDANFHALAAAFCSLSARWRCMN